MYIKLINNKFYWIISTIYELISDLDYNGVCIVVSAMEMVMVEELCLSISGLLSFLETVVYIGLTCLPCNPTISV